MSESRPRLTRIVIAGGGQVAAITALALKRALPQADVMVIGLPGHPAAYADQASTALPFSNRLHDRLGLDEDSLIRRAGASHRLLARYIGWGAEGVAGAMPHGAQVDPQLRTRFAAEWGGGPRAAATARVASSLAEVLADAGRFAVPPGDVATPLDDVDYGLRWHMPAYRDLLVGLAQAAGVGHLAGPIVGIEPDGTGGIAALAVGGPGGGQGRITADLYIDCSGPDAVLLSALAEFKRDDWSTFLPVRRVLHARPGAAMLALEDRCTLLPEGWLSEIAGRDGHHVALGLRDGVAEDQAVRALGADPAELVTLSPGCAAAPWIGNVVALGDAAATFEPLGHLNLDLAHRQLMLLLDLLPGRLIEPLERIEFNRRAGLMAQQVRDTLASHYAAPRACAIFGAQTRPASLSHVLDQYTRRGRLPFREEAALLPPEYMALLDALGLSGAVTIAAKGRDARDGDAARRAFAAQTRAALDFAPPYRQFMADVLG